MIYKKLKTMSSNEGFDVSSVDAEIDVKEQLVEPLKLEQDESSSWMLSRFFRVLFRVYTWKFLLLLFMTQFLLKGLRFFSF
jgi:hypothetical protein